MPGGWGRAGQLLPAPPHQRATGSVGADPAPGPAPAAGAEPGRTPRDPRRSAQRPVRRHGAGRGVGHAARRRRLPRLDLHVLPAATPGRRNPGTAPPSHPPGHRETGTGCLPAEFRVVVGHHQAARPREVDVLLPVRDLGHLFAVRGRLDGRHPRIRGSGRGADPPDLRQAGHRQPIS